MVGAASDGTQPIAAKTGDVVQRRLKANVKAAECLEKLSSDGRIAMTDARNVAILWQCGRNPRRKM